MRDLALDRRAYSLATPGRSDAREPTCSGSIARVRVVLKPRAWLACACTNNGQRTRRVSSRAAPVRLCSTVDDRRSRRPPHDACRRHEFRHHGDRLFGQVKISDPDNSKSFGDGRRLNSSRKTPQSASMRDPSTAAREARLTAKMKYFTPLSHVIGLACQKRPNHHITSRLFG
jgi:hypothetical protein